MSEDWHSTFLPQLLTEYKTCDIFNADETGLFYQAIPDASHGKQTEMQSSECITIFMCANMNGTEKRRLFVIGRSKRPCCLRNVRLPVDYAENPNACMTAELFSGWLQQWDKQLSSIERKVLLFVSDCPAHSMVDQLKCIKVVLLPQSLSQPLKQGIARCFKQHYRKLLCESLLCQLEGEACSRVADLAGRVSLLDAITNSAIAWKHITPSIITICFKKAAFVVPLEHYNTSPTTFNIPPANDNNNNNILLVNTNNNTLVNNNNNTPANNSILPSNNNIPTVKAPLGISQEVFDNFQPPGEDARVVSDSLDDDIVKCVKTQSDVRPMTLKREEEMRSPLAYKELRHHLSVLMEHFKVTGDVEKYESLLKMQLSLLKQRLPSHCEQGGFLLHESLISLYCSVFTPH